MVVAVPGAGGGLYRHREHKGDPDPGFEHDQQRDKEGCSAGHASDGKAAEEIGKTEERPYGWKVRESVKDGKKTEYKPAIDIVIAAYKMGGATEFQMEAYFETLTPDMMKSRLHGWQLWHVYAKEQGVTLELLRQHPNPAFILGGFVRFLAESEIGDHKRREAMPAVQLIMEVVRPGFKVMESVYLRTIIQGYATGTVRQPRYKTIWNLGIMMDYIAKGPPSEKLARRQLYGRAAFVFMTLGPLRPAAQIRLRPDQERREPDGSSIEVCGHSKTDKKRGVTWSVLRRVETVNLCPGRS
jgi:hypothetical protein